VKTKVKYLFHFFWLDALFQVFEIQHHSSFFDVHTLDASLGLLCQILGGGACGGRICKRKKNQ
jgi:hypothetical protein